MYGKICHVGERTAEVEGNPYRLLYFVDEMHNKHAKKFSLVTRK